MRHSQGHFAYNAAKGATVHLSKLMSAEFEKAEIRVNSIAPGYFPSEMTMKERDDSNKTHMPAEKVQEKGREFSFPNHFFSIRTVFELQDLSHDSNLISKEAF